MLLGNSEKKICNNCGYYVYRNSKLEFKDKFGYIDAVRLYIAPGRVELSGNHTDHQKLSKGVCCSPRQDCNQEAARPSARFSKECLWENSMWFMIL